MIKGMYVKDIDTYVICNISPCKFMIFAGKMFGWPQN